MKGYCVLAIPAYAPGSLPPAGYLEGHAWAQVQLKAGLRQRLCQITGKWEFPQEHFHHIKEVTP